MNSSLVGITRAAGRAALSMVDTAKALIIRAGFRDILNFHHNKEPHK